MERYAIGDKVHSPPTRPDDKCKIKGTVVGHGWLRNQPVIMVDLGEGGYISNASNYSYVQVIPVCPDYLEKD